MVHIAKVKFNGDPNIGLYGIATDSYCLIGKSLLDKYKKKLEEVLKVPVIGAKIYGSDLFGIFCNGNSKVLLVPDIIYKAEYDYLVRSLRKHKVKVIKVDTIHTAFSNNMLLNDKTAIISDVYSKKEFEKIKKSLGIKCVRMSINNLQIVGSIGFVNDKGGIFSPNLTDKEIEKVEKLFGFEIGLGTVNMGNPFVSSGLIGNSNGFLMGGLSSGFEIARVDESLGFI
jgi:translation initiation factor 6